jgi:hypothetical protein
MSSSELHHELRGQGETGKSPATSACFALGSARSPARERLTGAGTGVPAAVRPTVRRKARGTDCPRSGAPELSAPCRIFLRIGGSGGRGQTRDAGAHVRRGGLERPELPGRLRSVRIGICQPARDWPGGPGRAHPPLPPGVPRPAHGHRGADRRRRHGRAQGRLLRHRYRAAMRDGPRRGGRCRSGWSASCTSTGTRSSGSGPLPTSSACSSSSESSATRGPARRSVADLGMQCPVGGG